MLKTSHHSILHLIALLLAMTMILSHFAVQRLPAMVRMGCEVQSVTVKTATSPCQQSKTEHSSSGRSCGSLFGSYAILSDIIQFFFSLGGKLYFLFLAGLLALGHQRRCFKPPRCFVIA